MMEGVGVVNMDPFDKLYHTWGEHALSKRQDPPSRAVWDKIVLLLVLSKDPERVRLYRRLTAPGPDSLGGDAYDLWRKMPDGTPNLSAGVRTLPLFEEYEQRHIGSMRSLMEAQGLSEQYASLVEAQNPTQVAQDTADPDKPVDRARARRAQMNMLMLGCVGMGAILFMVMTVLLIIALKTMSR